MDPLISPCSAGPFDLFKVIWFIRGARFDSLTIIMLSYQFRFKNSGFYSFFDRNYILVPFFEMRGVGKNDVFWDILSTK